MRTMMRDLQKKVDESKEKAATKRKATENKENKKAEAFADNDTTQNNTQEPTSKRRKKN